MPNNKSHHYVPKFYLRRFSRSEKSIDLFNIASERLIRNAPIRGQSCRDYFYGKDPESEKRISAIEGEVAELFRMIDRAKRPPLPFSGGHLLLCFHIVTQAHRTKYAADALNELVNGMTRQVFKHEPGVSREMLEHVKFGYDDAALMSMANAAQGFPLAMDLECCLLLAPPGTEFITSDNPVVMYNKLLSWRTIGSNTGIAAKGLQIFFPVWPFLTLVMYDRDVYRFGGARLSSTVHMASATDVHEMNVLQAVSASENIYLFSPAADIFRVMKDAIQYRRPTKVKVRTFQRSAEGRRGSELIAASQEDVRANVRLDFMRISKHARGWLEAFRAQQRQPAVVVRNDALVQRFDAHADAVRRGAARHEDAVLSIFGRRIEDGTF